MELEKNKKHTVLQTFNLFMFLALLTVFFVLVLRMVLYVPTDGNGNQLFREDSLEKIEASK